MYLNIIYNIQSLTDLIGLESPKRARDNHSSRFNPICCLFCSYFLEIPHCPPIGVLCLGLLLPFPDN